MPQSFENIKQLRFVLTLQTGKFGSSNNNQLTLQGLWAVADIEKGGGAMMPRLKAKIYGVSQSDMNSACTLQWKTGLLMTNTVEVYAIDGQQETLVFIGNIINAWGDYLGMPDVFLMVQAQGGFAQQLQSAPPSSFKGQVDVATVMGQLANNMGLVFENNGVNVKMQDVYLANTNLEQAKELADSAGIDLYLDDNTLAITPRAQPRNTSQIPLISSQTGMIGYPPFDGIGVNFRTLFNPAIKFGGSIKIQSDVQQACGQWVATSIAHHLDTQPGGAWHSTVRGTLNGLAVIS